MQASQRDWWYGTGLFSLIALCGMPAAVGAAPYPTAVDVAPIAQSDAARGRIEPPLLTPWEATTVKLLTHTADFMLLPNDAAVPTSDLRLMLDATYRFANDGDSPVTLTVKIAEPTQGNGIDDALLTVDGIPVTLYQTEGVGYAAQFQMNADTRTTVQLAYELGLADLPLPLLSYQAAALSAWPGNPSLRVSVTMPEQISPESWLHIAPDGWHYATSDRADFIGVKWLYDAQIPRTPFVFELIHPSRWAQLQQLTEQATVDATAYLPLGNQYRTLLEATPPTADYRAVRERFYAQALAAYSTGVDLPSNGTSRGELYAALAALYRLQAAQPDGTTRAEYATAMIDAAQRALAQLPTADPRRRELAQWVADGLQVDLATAQQREDWMAALRTVEQLSTLPPEVVDAGMLEQTKRSITVRQALQLLEEGNRTGAVALAGEDLLSRDLLPPSGQTPLFRRWEISTTVSPTMIELVVTPFAVDARAADALGALNALAATLQAAAEEAIGVQWQPTDGGDALGELLIAAPTDASFASLTTAIPPVPDWALLYTLLRQLQPTVDTQAALFNRSTQLRLSIDLHAADEVWRVNSAELDGMATALEAEAATHNPRDATAAESALQLRIRAANYRGAAHAWQTVSQDSWVAIQFVMPSGLRESTQTWLMTTVSPATVLTLQSAPSTVASFMSVLIVAMGGLLFLSGLLWWLL
ncbi:MAG: hypothetical protein KDE19_04175 [Caldilineaceae bacterium]|nr:hypothetical protein [Caldilineaceae bacterium]